MYSELALEQIALIPIKSSSNPNGRDPIVEPLKCADGIVISVQASSKHECTPMDNVGPWIEFEVITDETNPLLEPYLMGSRYTRVPIDILRKLIDIHGGLIIDGVIYKYVGSGESIKERLIKYYRYPNSNGFQSLQEFMRRINHIDKRCGFLDCGHCSYFKSSMSGHESLRSGGRAFCPFTAITHKEMLSCTNGPERKDIVDELLYLLEDTPLELHVENL